MFSSVEIEEIKSNRRAIAEKAKCSVRYLNMVLFEDVPKKGKKAKNLLLECRKFLDWKLETQD